MNDNQIEVVFFKTSGLVSSLIRFFTFSKWNHVGIIIEGDYYDSNLENGVSKNNMWYLHNAIERESIFINVTNEQIKTLKLFVSRYLDLPYDLKAIFAFPFQRDWQYPNKYFCSELVATLLVDAQIINKTKSNRITPRDLYLILKQIS